MSRFKTGDRVRLVENYDGHERGYEFTVDTVSSDTTGLTNVYPLGCYDYRLELVTKANKEEKAMSSNERFYRVRKDLPAWVAGAILRRRSDGDYEAISDLWESFETNYPKEYVENKQIVENSPEFFERVYSVGALGRAKYVLKEAARKLHDKDFKENK